MKHIGTLPDHWIFPSPDRGVLDGVPQVRPFAVLYQIDAITPIMVEVADSKVNLIKISFRCSKVHHLMRSPGTLHRSKRVMVKNNQSLLGIDERLCVILS